MGWFDRQTAGLFVSGLHGLMRRQGGQIGLERDPRGGYEDGLGRAGGLAGA
ncbi:hypothetical protein OHB24_35635 [Kribbella sp. NBC_00482]|uniref:hypothetical protein n=1 Tax=Kribbella sp. NBC_00482 TaxID=2975968 RepID=UPI002E18248E